MERYGMNNQNQPRPFLAPLQTSQLDFAAAVRSNKRMRCAKSQPTTDGDCSVANDEQNASPACVFRSQFPDPFRFHSRPGGSPLPPLKWADREDVWQLMCRKEQTYRRDPNIFQRHPQIMFKMRSVLFEWISEVCEVYKLHRETFYLCIDFVDRYLSEEHNLPKMRLQLVGITALFIAAKLEEIYPPQLKDFAYVTDRACTTDQILAMELDMLKTLKWALSPVTVNHWLMIFLQVVANEVNTNMVRSGMLEWRCRDFLIPQFQRYPYIRLTQLTDLCLLDAGSLQFPYSVIAASAFYHMLQPDQMALLVSGYAWADLEACMTWMEPFAEVIKETDASVKIFPEIPHDDMHNIQSHFVSMAFLEKAQTLATEYVQNCTPPATAYGSQPYDIFPTPPRSDERRQPLVSRLPQVFPSDFMQTKQNF